MPDDYLRLIIEQQKALRAALVALKIAGRDIPPAWLALAATPIPASSAPLSYQLSAPKQITRSEAARLLRYSVKTVDRLIACKRLPSTGKGRHRRILVSDIEKLLQELAEGKPLWQNDRAVRPAKAQSTKTNTVNGGRPLRSPMADERPFVVLKARTRSGKRDSS
jgi:excisionase family DNA binding protein